MADIYKKISEYNELAELDASGKMLVAQSDETYSVGADTMADFVKGRITMDAAPTQGSSNPVTSNGVYNAVSAVQTEVDALEVATTPDATLRIQGAAADAKATGDEIADLKTQNSNLYTVANKNLFISAMARGRLSTSGNITSMPNYCYNPDYLTVFPCLVKAEGYYTRIAYYNAQYEFISATEDKNEIIISPKEGLYFRVCISSIDGSEIPISTYPSVIEAIALYSIVDKTLQVKNTAADSYTVGEKFTNVMVENPKVFYIHASNAAEKSGLRITIDNNFVTIDGTSSSTVRLKLSNGIEVSDTVKATWRNEVVPFFEVGKSYWAYNELVSGTATAAPLVSARTSTDASVASVTRNPALLGSQVAYVQFWIPAGTYDKAKYGITFVNSYTDSGYNQIKWNMLNNSMEIPQIPHYETVEGLNHSDVYDDSFGYYSAIQGFCTDGERYAYWAIWTSDSAVTNLRKYDIETGEIVASRSDYNYGHCNGLAFIPNENVLYAIKLDQTGTVFKINADTLEYIESFSLNDILSPKIDWWAGVGAVAYNRKYEKIIFLIRGDEDENGVAKKGFAIFDKYMNFEKIVRTIYLSDSFAYGGIFSSGDIIYLSDTMKAPSGSHYNRIVAYDFQGNYIYEVRADWYNHLEGGGIIGDNFYLAFANNFNVAKIVAAEPAAKGFVPKADIVSQYNLN